MHVINQMYQGSSLLIIFIVHVHVELIIKVNVQIIQYQFCKTDILCIMINMKLQQKNQIFILYLYDF